MPTHDDVKPRRTGPYPAYGSLTPSQRVGAVEPRTPVSNWDHGAFAALIAYTIFVSAWLVSASPLLAEWRVFAGVAPILSLVAAQIYATRAVLTRDVERGTRTFWLTATVALFVHVVAWSLAFLASERQQLGLATLFQSAGQVLTLPILLHGLLRFPAAPRNPVDKSRFWLDAATVAVGGLLVMWYDLRTPTDAISPLVSSTPLSRTLLHASLTADMVLLLTVSVLWRRTVAIIASNVFLLLSLAMLVQFLVDVGALVSARAGAGGGEWTRATLPIIACLWAASARLQRNTLQSSLHHRTAQHRASQGTTLIPYVAVLPGVALLLKAANEQHAQPLGGMVIGAVVLTGLAFAHQVVSNRENVRILAESKAKESEARFRALVQHSSDVITIVDSDSTIRYVSPAVASVFGYEARQDCRHAPRRSGASG